MISNRRANRYQTGVVGFPGTSEVLPSALSTPENKEPRALAVRAQTEKEAFLTGSIVASPTENGGCHG